MKKEKIKCANPNCTATFEPYSSRQRVCRKKECRLWLRESAYTKTEYRLTEEKIDAIHADLIFEIGVDETTGSSDQIKAILELIVLTNDDLEKI